MVYQLTKSNSDPAGDDARASPVFANPSFPADFDRYPFWYH